MTQPAVLSLALTKNNASCGGVCDGKATATLTGGTPPYKYDWSNGSVTTTGSLTNTIINLCAGTYSVTITDNNNCVKSGAGAGAGPAGGAAAAAGAGGAGGGAGN